MGRQLQQAHSAYRAALFAICLVTAVGIVSRILGGQTLLLPLPPAETPVHGASNSKRLGAQYQYQNAGAIADAIVESSLSQLPPPPLVDPVCFRDKHVVLLGDSTMARAALAFQDLFNCTMVREGSRCDFASYYGDAVNNGTHSKPIPPGSGPFGYGSANRGCMDCSGCHPRRWHCAIAKFTVELVGIEFARDVEYPTAHGDFTQESIIRGYLAREYGTHAAAPAPHPPPPPPHAIVFNEGIHDLGMPGTSTGVSATALYESNVDWLTSLLHDTFRVRGTRLLWVSTSAIVPETQNPKYRSVTANDKLVQYNQAAERVMRKWGVPVFDVFPLTQRPEIKALCLDGIHYGTPSQFYYRYVALNLAMTLCGDGRPS